MCFASVEGECMGFVRHTFFKGDDKRLSSAFISNQNYSKSTLCFFLEIRFDQLSMAFTDKIPQKYALNIVFLTQSTVFSSVAQWPRRLPCTQAVRIQASADPVFFSIFPFWKRGLLLFVFHCSFLFHNFFVSSFVLYSCFYPLSDLHKAL